MSYGWRRRITWPMLSVSLLLLAVFLLIPTVRAGDISGTRDYLLRQQSDLTSGQVHQLFFIPATSLGGSGNKVIISFPIDQSGLWCRTAGGDATVTGLADPQGATEGATVLPGTLTAACSKGNNTTTGDVLTVSGVGPLVADTKYGFQLSGGTIARLGTPDPANNILVTIKTNNGVIDVDDGSFPLSVRSSDRVTISASVETAPEPPVNPIVQFKGRSSLDTDVHVHRDTTAGAPLAIVPTDPAAKFDITLTNQPTGSHLYTIDSNDIVGRPHTAASFALNLTAGSTTVITGVFLGPTIAVDKTKVKLGETVNVLGRTAPSSTVTLTVNSEPVTLVVASDGVGDWKIPVQTSLVGVGTHTAVAQAVSVEDTVSETSEPVTFAVNPLGLCDGKATADINCDGQVNLTDFSIMLYYWQQRDPANARADINNDGIVSIVDFSIMLYQWTGY